MTRENILLLNVSRSSLEFENGFYLCSNNKGYSFNQNFKYIAGYYKKQVKLIAEIRAIGILRIVDNLFANEDGETISPGLFRVWLQKILFRAGLPIVTLHSLRHTNITLQLIAGVDIKTVSARAGHAQASTTSDFYSHFITNSDIYASEIINKIFE